MWHRLKAISNHPQLHVLLLLAWVLLGAGLRFANLTAKTLWADEFSTIVFSLGNSFLTVPLDQVLSAERLLQPLQPDSQAGLGSVIHHLFTESNHPPLYFVLTHLWLKLFPTSEGGLVSLWGVRSLSALFGVATIPATFCLGWLAFRSRIVGQISAALMAVSPFAVYLAQEARHYTLATLWVIGCLGCLILATRSIRSRTSLSIWVCLTWIVINGLGVATHYFFTLTLVLEALVLVGFLVRLQRNKEERSGSRWRLGSVIAGTLAGILVWLPMLGKIRGGQLTQWLYRNGSGWRWLDPITQSLAGWVTMLYLLPIQAISHGVVLASGAILILVTLWTLPKLYWGLKAQWLQPERLSVQVLGGVVGGAIALFFAVAYLFGIDLTSAFRYNFVYFPAAIVLVGAALASSWNAEDGAAQSVVAAPYFRLLQPGTPRTVLLIGLISFLGGLTVVSNLGYQKTHRPDVVAQAIRQNSRGTALVAIAHQTHGQTGRAMGIAWNLQHTEGATPRFKPLFLLAHRGIEPKSAAVTLEQTLANFPKPFDLWMINFRPPPGVRLGALLKGQGCAPKSELQAVDGYEYRLYRCRAPRGNQEPKPLTSETSQ